MGPGSRFAWPGRRDRRLIARSAARIRARWRSNPVFLAALDCFACARNDGAKPLLSASRLSSKDPPMQYRQLGRSGLKVSPICLGTMMFGGPTDEATSARIVAKAREAGIN